VLPPTRSAGYCNTINWMEKITMNHIQWSCFPLNAFNSHNQFGRYWCTSPSWWNSKHVPLFIAFWWNAFESEPGKAQMWIDLGNHIDEWGKKKPGFSLPKAPTSGAALFAMGFKRQCLESPICRATMEFNLGNLLYTKWKKRTLSALLQGQNCIRVG